AHGDGDALVQPALAGIRVAQAYLERFLRGEQVFDDFAAAIAQAQHFGPGKGGIGIAHRESPPESWTWMVRTLFAPTTTSARRKWKRPLRRSAKYWRSVCATAGKAILSQGTSSSMKSPTSRLSEPAAKSRSSRLARKKRCTWLMCTRL